MRLRPLSEALQKKAREDVNEVPDRIKDDINAIKEWIAKQPHLKARTDDQWILSFLRGCKFSLERTKEKIDSYYTMRTLVPEFFKNRDPMQHDIQEILRQGVFLPLPIAENDEGPRIILLRWSTCDPNADSLISMAKTLFMIFEILINEDDNYVIAGQHLMGDYIDLKAGYIVKFTPILIKQITKYLQCVPVRLKGSCIFNCPSIFETVFNMGKLFMPEKLKKRMFLYSEENIENVFSHVPKSLLPRNYGGGNSSIEELTVEWKTKVENYREWFLNDETFCTDENLRTGIPHTSANTFGVEGSFRKLDID